MRNIGLLGGSFDPPHKGHLYISLEGKKILKLDEVWWLVTPQNPLKINQPASYKDRVKNCKLITKNHSIKIKEIEKKINSRYSYETIEYLNGYYKNIKFFWLMGADNLINFHKWQNAKKIFNEISIVVFRRYGYNEKALKSYTSNFYKNFRLISKKINVKNFDKLPAWTIIQNKEIKIS
ncbi:MAG: nicotinate (nicotinamide) nucleotide adenylyltransferase, partial [Pelagibacteraceae bacterium]|nr:nicotinate (nicotinamide) nucleotide adenylyltransferase [Pelagibacteraceae bacterium]